MVCTSGGAGVSEAVLVALISGGITLLGIIISSIASAKKSEHAMEVSQAVTDTKIDELTREVRLHNGFAEKIPVIQEQIRVINHRVDDLEGFHKPQ